MMIAKHSFDYQDFSESIKIVTLDSPLQSVLRKRTDDIGVTEFPLAYEIAQRLHAALKPFFPAAGLAAPQIGISKSIFIYSYDRDPKNLEVVINPFFEPIGNTKIEGWEGCFSSILCKENCKLAKVPRHEKIHVRYFNLEGKQIEKILEGFASKAFQHEYDHLQGMVNILREDASVMAFETEEEMRNFLSQVKKEDSKDYKQMKAF